jgi:hypothetical protein
MHLPDDSNYHSSRAMQELDRGLTARSAAAARAHLQLSSLHLQRAMTLERETPRPKPPCIMA